MEVVRLDGSFRPIDVSLAVGGHVVAEEAYGFHRRTDVGKRQLRLAASSDLSDRGEAKAAGGRWVCSSASKSGTWSATMLDVLSPSNMRIGIRTA